MCPISRSTISVRIDRTSPANGGAWPHSSLLRGIRNSPRCEVANPASRSLRGRYFQSFLPGGSVARRGCIPLSHPSLVFGQSIVRTAESSRFTLTNVLFDQYRHCISLATLNCLRRTVVILTDGQKESCRGIKRLWLLFIFYRKPCECLKSGLLNVTVMMASEPSSTAFPFSFFDNNLGRDIYL